MPRTALSYCTSEVRRYDRDRFTTALFAPAPVREDLMALYAFNLEIAKIREIVSQGLLGQIRLKWWLDVLTEIYEGRTVRRHGVAEPLASAIARRRLPREKFERLVESRQADMEEQSIADLPALAEYADATSGSLTQLALGILGAHDEEAMAAGREVGTAWALIGLVRAVPFHAAARRLYLPLDRLEAHGVDPEAVFASNQAVRRNPGLANVVREVADLAGQQLARARQRGVMRAALPALLPATLADLYLRRLASAGYDPFAAAATGSAGAGGVARLLWAMTRGRF